MIYIKARWISTRRHGAGLRRDRWRAIRAALILPVEERRTRCEAMMALLRGNTIQDWTANFLKALKGTRALG